MEVCYHYWRCVRIIGLVKCKKSFQIFKKVMRQQSCLFYYKWAKPVFCSKVRYKHIKILYPSSFAQEISSGEMPEFTKKSEPIRYAAWICKLKNLTNSMLSSYQMKWKWCQTLSSLSTSSRHGVWTIMIMV